MLAWIRDLGQFIHNNDYDFGTRSPDEYKTATPEGDIKIAKDERWLELLHLADVFMGKS